MRGHRGLGTGITASLRVAMLLLLSPALVACGGSSTKAATSPSPPSAATTPEALVGTDSVAVTKKVVDGYNAAFSAWKTDQFGPLYAADVAYFDNAFNVRAKGKAVVLKELRKSLTITTGTRIFAGYAGSGWGVAEFRWDYLEHSFNGSLQVLVLLESRGGKIVHEAWNYEPSEKGRTLAPAPLESAPGPQDTPSAAEGVAREYAAALQAQDAAAMAALSAPTIAFTDTASHTVGHDPGQVQARYARIFKPPSGVSLNFTQLRYAFGAGWAAVMWTADGDGVTMLEIRDGKIARETLYYTRGNVLFVP
jgi:ketosteroid isomerase-like protein